MLGSQNLEVVHNPGYGKPKVYRAHVKVCKMDIHDASDIKTLLSMACEQAREMIRPNIGTARGEYSYVCQNDYSWDSLGQYWVITVTWKSHCRAIKPPKPALQPKDIFGE